MNVAVVSLAALVPFTLKFTAAGGVPVVVQVYVKFVVPPLSAPTTWRAVVVPVAGLVEAYAAVETVGAVLAFITETFENCDVLNKVLPSELAAKPPKVKVGRWIVVPAVIRVQAVGSMAC